MVDAQTMHNSIYCLEKSALPGDKKNFFGVELGYLRIYLDDF
jgi:hypothetical protein